MSEKKSPDTKTRERAFDIYKSFLASTPGAMQRAVRAMASPDYSTGEARTGEIQAAKKNLADLALASRLAAEAFEEAV